MRIDLPLCDMDDCKWCAGGNCTATEVRRVRCPYLHYTDLAEQGRLVELPYDVKIGDTIYDAVLCDDGNYRIVKMEVGLL